MAELNEGLYKLNKFLQENPKLSKGRFGESVSLIAIDAMTYLINQVDKYENALVEINEYIPTQNLDRDVHKLKTIADKALQ